MKRLSRMRLCCFTVVFFSVCPLFAETEPNNTPATANVLAVNSSVSGTVGDSIAPFTYDTYDWYSITLPSDGKLTLTSVASGTNADIQLYIYRMPDSMNLTDPSGDYTGGGGNAVNDTATDFLRAGTVWVQVINRATKGSYTLYAAFAPAALTNDAENNDTPLVAQTQTLNTTVTGHMGYYANKPGSDNNDWYKFTTPSDGKVTFTTQTSDGNLDVQLYIYRFVDDMKATNPSGDYSGGGGTGVNDTVVNKLHAGTYYLQIIRRGGVGSYTLINNFTPAALADDAENNDTPIVANTIAVNTIATGHMGYYSNALGSDNYDWYKLATPLDGKLSMIAHTSDGDLDLQLYIYRSVDDMKASNSSGDYSGGGGDLVDDTATNYLRAGQVYVQVIRRGGIGSYTLTTAFTAAGLNNDAEPNDIPNQAIMLPLDSTRTGHLGYYSSALGSDSYDWFKITVPTLQKVVVKSLVIEGSLDLQIYIYKTVDDMNAHDPSGLYYGGGGTVARDTATSDTLAGTCYVQVIRRAGVGSYVIASGAAQITVPVIQAIPGKQQAGKALPKVAFLTTARRAGSSVAIRYGLAVPGDVVFELYTMSGRKAAEIEKRNCAAGTYEQRLDGLSLSGGTYFCRMKTGATRLLGIVRYVK